MNSTNNDIPVELLKDLYLTRNLTRIQTVEYLNSHGYIIDKKLLLDLLACHCLRKTEAQVRRNQGLRNASKRKNQILFLTACGYSKYYLSQKHMSGISKIDLSRMIMKDARIASEMSFRQIEKSIDVMLPRTVREYLIDVRPDLEALYLSTNTVQFSKLTTGGNLERWWVCKIHGYEYKKSPVRMVTQDRQCPICNNSIVVSGVNDLASREPNYLKEWDYSTNVINPSQIYVYSHLKVSWICQFCQFRWRATLGNRVGIKTNCPKCSIVSYFEHSIHQEIDKIFKGEIIRNSRPIKHNESNYQLDFHLPEINLAFEIQDFATHSKNSNKEELQGLWKHLAIKGGRESYKKGPEYHDRKRRLALEQLHVTLIDIWEDSIRDGSFKTTLEVEINNRLGVLHQTA